MGLGSFLDLFRTNNWSDELVGMIGEMLDLSMEMYGFATMVVVEGEIEGDPQVEIFDRDQRINALERKIRRRVISRLSVRTSSGEIPSALIFMSVVKDCERIGDFIKNYYQVSGMMPANVDRDLYKEQLHGRSKTIEDLIGVTTIAFANGDKDQAKSIVDRAHTFRRDIEATIGEITKSELTTNDAVCLVLIMRFYKRVASHLANIASAVFMPVDMIDFFDEQ